MNVRGLCLFSLPALVVLVSQMAATGGPAAEPGSLLPTLFGVAALLILRRAVRGARLRPLPSGSPPGSKAAADSQPDFLTAGAVVGLMMSASGSYAAAIDPVAMFQELSVTSEHSPPAANCVNRLAVGFTPELVQLDPAILPIAEDARPGSQGVLCPRRWSGKGPGFGRTYPSPYIGGSGSVSPGITTRALVLDALIETISPRSFENLARVTPRAFQGRYDRVREADIATQNKDQTQMLVDLTQADLGWVFLGAVIAGGQTATVFVAKVGAMGVLWPLGYRRRRSHRTRRCRQYRMTYFFSNAMAVPLRICARWGQVERFSACLKPAKQVLCEPFAARRCRLKPSRRRQRRR